MEGCYSTVLTVWEDEAVETATELSRKMRIASLKRGVNKIR